MSHKKMMPKNIDAPTSGVSEVDAAKVDAVEKDNFLNAKRSARKMTQSDDDVTGRSINRQQTWAQKTQGGLPKRKTRHSGHLEYDPDRESQSFALKNPSHKDRNGEDKTHNGFAGNRDRTLQDNRSILQTLHKCCSRNQVNDEITYKILSLLRDDELPQSDQRRSSFLVGRSATAMTAKDYLALYMKQQIDVSGGLDPSNRTTILIGPTGVGKTTTLAKLAAQYHFQQGKAVGLISIDAYRIAAVDQLKIYAQIMSIPLRVALTPQELENCIDEYKNMDLILVDTPGRSQFDTDSLDTLEQFLDAAQPADTHLLMALSTKEEDACTVAENFAPQYVRQVIFTKLDETSSFGSILNICSMMGKPVSYLTTGQNVPDDIEVAQVERMVGLLLDA